jgi:thiamine transporter
MAVTSNDRIRVIVEIALTIALAAVLNMIKLWRMPQGGTLSLVMLPIVVLSLRRGPAVGVATGALYGFVDWYIDPVAPVHWLQYVLDYPVAYAAVGLSGFFAKPWSAAASKGAWALGFWGAVVPAVAVGALGKYAAHVLSGYVYFGEYAPEGTPVLVYSLVYNSTVLVSAVLTAVAAAAVMPALTRATAPNAPHPRET